MSHFTIALVFFCWFNVHTGCNAAILQLLESFTHFFISCARVTINIIWNIKLCGKKGGFKLHKTIQEDFYKSIQRWRWNIFVIYLVYKITKACSIVTLRRHLPEKQDVQNVLSIVMISNCWELLAKVVPHFDILLFPLYVGAVFYLYFY